MRLLHALPPVQVRGVLLLDCGGVAKVGLASIWRLGPRFCWLTGQAVAAGELRVCWRKEEQLAKAGLSSGGQLKAEEVAVRDLALLAQESWSCASPVP